MHLKTRNTLRVTLLLLPDSTAAGSSSPIPAAALLARYGHRGLALFQTIPEQIRLILSGAGRILHALDAREAETWPDGRPSRYYDDVPGVEESKGDRNYPDGDRPEPYGGDYEDESDDEDDSDSDDEDDEDDSDDDDDEDDEDDSDSDDERRGAEVEAIRNFGLISRDPRQMQELSAVVDNAEMRTIEGEPETIEQRDLANQIARAIAGTSSFTKADTLDKNGKPKPLSELMRMARVTSLWPVLSELQKRPYMQTRRVYWQMIVTISHVMC